MPKDSEEEKSEEPGIMVTVSSSEELFVTEFGEALLCCGAGGQEGVRNTLSLPFPH